MRKNILFILLLFFIVFVVAIVVGLSFTEEKSVVKIGVILPLTGKSASAAEASKNMVSILQDYYKKHNVDVQIILEDSKSTNEGAISAYHKLVQLDEIKLIIGGLTSSEAIALCPLAQSDKVIFLTTSATSLTVNKCGDYVFKLREDVTFHGEKMAEYMKMKNYSNVAIVYADIEYANDLMKTYPKYLIDKNIDLAIVEKYNPQDVDFKTQLIKVKEVNPDAIYLVGYYEDIPLLIKQAFEMGLKTNYLSFSSVETPLYYKVLGELGDGLVYTNIDLNCNFVFDTEKLCDMYFEKYNKNLEFRSALLFDGVGILFNAIKKVGYAPEKLKIELLDTKYNGLSGTTIFDVEGNANRPIIFKIASKGKFSNLN